LKLKAEAALVGEAQRALGAGRSGEALARLAQYDQRFPAGALRSEADATRVFALCQSGRTREAAAARDSFLRRYPSSPAAPRVRSACAGR
jgi:outer membrane protein assembly factor BamD (BamD/ComL family)